jgi:hypothetical protein
MPGRGINQFPHECTKPFCLVPIGKTDSRLHSAALVCFDNDEPMKASEHDLGLHGGPKARTSWESRSLAKMQSACHSGLRQITFALVLSRAQSSDESNDVVSEPRDRGMMTMRRTVKLAKRKKKEHADKR